MRRRLLNLLTLLSLLPCVATVVVCLRSQFVSGEVLLRGKRTTLQLITGGEGLFVRQWLPDDRREGEKTGVYHSVDRQYNPWRFSHPPATPLLRRLGFDGYGFDQPELFDGLSARAVTVPYWFLFFLTAAAPTLWARRAGRRVRQRRRTAGGVCPACGYDLRATPGKCPECGTVASVGTDA